jgi:hypothetical protein
MSTTLFRPALLLLTLTLVAATPPAAPTAVKAPPTVSRQQACELRFAALCRLLKRCLPEARDTGSASCDAIDPGCDRLTGDAPFNRAELDACVAAVEGAACGLIEKGDPNDPSSMDVESRLAACRPLAEPPAKVPGRTKPGK